MNGKEAPDEVRNSSSEHHQLKLENRKKNRENKGGNNAVAATAAAATAQFSPAAMNDEKTNGHAYNPVRLAALVEHPKEKTNQPTNQPIRLEAAGIRPPAPLCHPFNQHISSEIFTFLILSCERILVRKGTTRKTQVGPPKRS